MSFSSTFSAAIWVLNDRFLRQTAILWYQQSRQVRAETENSILILFVSHSDSNEVCNEYETNNLTPTQHIQCKQPSLPMNELLIRLKLW